MSDIKTVFSFFYTQNHTGEYSTTGYALPFCYFKFIPKLNVAGVLDPDTAEPIVEKLFSKKRIVWDFGDGTTMEAVTASHSYKEPGQYTVTCYLYDKYGEGYYDIFSQKVDVFNYITDSITLSSTQSIPFTVYSGRFTPPITVNRSTSWQFYEVAANEARVVDNTPVYRRQTNLYPLPGEEVNITDREDKRNLDITKPVSIIAYVSGANINYFNDGIVNKHYGHLYPYSSTYQLLTGLNNETEFVEVSSISTTSLPIYVKLSANQVVQTTALDKDGYFCGTVGTGDVYFKDDIAGSSNVLLGFETGSIKSYSNTSTVGFTVSVVQNIDYNHLSITSNGLDSEGTTTNLFPIDQNKFSNTKMGVVVKVKDSLGYTIKDLPLFSYPNDFAYFVINNIDGYTIHNDFGSLSSLDKGGFWKGYIIPEQYNTVSPEVTIEAAIEYFFPEFVNTETTALDVLTEDSTPIIGYLEQKPGSSNGFYVYPKEGYYNVAKINEDIDFESKFKEIAIQPLFLDKKILFTDFLGSIFGNISSAQTAMGKVAYEKIANFASNNAVLDYSNVEQLLSIIKSYDVTDPEFVTSNFNLPNAIGRLADLLSINHSRLFGSQNKFSEDFYTKGYFNSDVYGTNLGAEITLNYTVTAGQHLVAFEKFGGTYKLLNTYAPLCASSVTLNNNTYKLSSYNNTWSWGLMLPADGYGLNMSNYYLFYKYKPGIEGTINDSIINFNDTNTTLNYTTSSYKDWSKKDGIISNILIKGLTEGLNLFV